MKSLVIGALGGVVKHEHHKAVAARDNYEVLYNQYRDRASALEHNLEKMEEQFLRASAQAEQLRERLHYTEQQLENKEEERANASAGWTKERRDHLQTLDQYNFVIIERDTHKNKLTDAERRIAELNTLIAKESDGSDIEFFIQGGNPAEGRAGSRTPLRLVMTSVKGSVERHVELRSLSYSKANREILEKIMELANKAVRG